ncbi:hypothetical protein ABU614_10240 [Lysobacter firmicutimachus]|uniref:DUF998 domain-containing protein n=1 Tax=Lysobacter firmicutimachus TaxID=1792846 RepID=A0AAU8N0Y9_9GAMM
MLTPVLAVASDFTGAAALFIGIPFSLACAMALGTVLVALSRTNDDVASPQGVWLVGGLMTAVVALPYIGVLAALGAHLDWRQLSVSDFDSSMFYGVCLGLACISLIAMALLLLLPCYGRFKEQAATIGQYVAWLALATLLLIAPIIVLDYMAMLRAPHPPWLFVALLPLLFGLVVWLQAKVVHASKSE